jgi:TRAP transporter 4TM/12TM fusion protein
MVEPARSGASFARLLERFARSGAIQTSRTLDNLWPRATATTVSLTFVTLYWYYAGWGYFTPESFIAPFLGFTFVLIFLCYARSPKSPAGRLTLLDIVLLLGAIGATLHYTFYFPVRFVERFGEPEWHDIIAGTVLVVVALEAGRRVIGGFLPGLCVVLIVYALFGPYFPGMFRHPGISLWDVIGWLYSSEAMYGSITRVFASFVFLFVVLGTTLEQSGGRNLFIDVPLSLLGWLKGGPAKVAVVASALFGMVSGAAAANVVSTGTLTIPLMKRAGFPPHVAAAFEATASTIGITMPPLMGAAIFIMADFTGIPYLEIVKVSVIPALLFVVSLLMIADAYARRYRIEGLPRSEFGDPWALLKIYWPFLIPIGLVIGLLVSGRSPDAAVFYALPSVVVVSLLYKETRLPVARWMEIFDLGVRRSLTIGGIAGCLGIIVGIVIKTGLAIKLSHIVIDYSSGYLLVAVMLTALATFFLGMGVSSVTADYILLSVLIAPALIELGAPIMAAHLLIIWYTQTSNLTPPVCTVAFAGAAIADAHPWRTGFLAFRFGLFIYLLPLAFLYGGLVDFGDPLLLIRTTVAACISAYAFSGALIGYRAGMLAVWQRALLLAASFALFHPSWPAISLGTGLTVFVIGYQLIANRSAAAAVGKAVRE